MVVLINGGGVIIYKEKIKIKLNPCFTPCKITHSRCIKDLNK